VPDHAECLLNLGDPLRRYARTVMKSSIPAGVDQNSIRAVSDSTRKVCGTPPAANMTAPGRHMCG
jgi:hypothetical protein